MSGFALNLKSNFENNVEATISADDILLSKGPNVDDGSNSILNILLEVLILSQSSRIHRQVPKFNDFFHI